MRILEINAIRHHIRSAGWKPALLVPGVAATVFILGFAVSLGQVFLIRGYLRRAAESAAQAAAFLLREDGSLPQMTAAAEAVVRAEGLDAAALRVDTCATDPALCAPGEGPAGRKVRVTIETDFSPTPLVMLFSRGIHLEASAVGTETALDVVLVIDSSESMAWDNSPYPTLNYDEDPANPAVCNLDDSCMPFHNVKAAAADFAAAVLDKPPGEEMDRLAVVTFANGWEADSRGTRTLLGGNWTNDLSEALDPTYGIPGMHVYAATDICPLNNDMVCGGWNPIACYPTVDDIPTGPCIYVGDQSANPYSVNPFWGYNCARLWDIDTGDGDHWTGRDAAISACTTTNTGGGLYRAAEQFNYEQRPNALRVVILLTDGPANATFATESDLDPVGGGYDPVTTGFPLDPAVFIPNLPLGYCPAGTWVGPGWPPPGSNPNRMYCQDGLADTHHSLAAEPDLYDADDFARDQAKLVACAASGTPNPSCMGLFGEEALIFTIGLGDQIIDLLDDNPIVPDRQPYGASLLRYIAALGDDGDAATDPCAGEPDFSASCGNYYHAAGSADLPGIFDDISDRLDAFLVPAPFGKLGPPDGGYASTGPTLSWEESGKAEYYIYCVDTVDNGICDTAWEYTGASTGASLSGLDPEQIYYWFAAAGNSHGTTYADGGIWWSFTALPVSFIDVPSTHWAWPWIERLFAAGITSGCGGGNYCPNNPVTRAEMAVFLERGIHGSSYTPPAATGTVFGDVPASHWAAAWIEGLYADGITGGCGGGNYCPDVPSTRAEMAILLLRAKHGPSYTPPAATGTVFGDVPAFHWAAAWIEQFAAEGITGGCGGGNYCPNSPVTRAEMAIFLVRTFELP